MSEKQSTLAENAGETKPEPAKVGAVTTGAVICGEPAKLKEQETDEKPC
jgi:hypothetical protein